MYGVRRRGPAHSPRFPVGSFLQCEATAERASPRLGDELVCHSRVRAARVLGKHRVCSLAALPLTDHEEVPGVVEVFDQDVPEVAGKAFILPPGIT